MNVHKEARPRSDMTSLYGVERQVSSEEAYGRILELIRLHNLVVSTVHTGSDIKTFQATISDDNIKKRFIGCGKGIGIQSKVSALFEAFEHYISYVTFHDEKRCYTITGGPESEPQVFDRPAHPSKRFH